MCHLFDFEVKNDIQIIAYRGTAIFILGDIALIFIVDSNPLKQTRSFSRRQYQQQNACLNVLAVMYVISSEFQPFYNVNMTANNFGL